jgi:hypothetical protein
MRSSNQNNSEFKQSEPNSSTSSLCRASFTSTSKKTTNTKEKSLKKDLVKTTPSPKNIDKSSKQKVNVDVGKKKTVSQKVLFPSLPKSNVNQKSSVTEPIKRADSVKTASANIPEQPRQTEIYILKPIDKSSEDKLSKENSKSKRSRDVHIHTADELDKIWCNTVEKQSRKMAKQEGCYYNDDGEDFPIYVAAIRMADRKIAAIKASDFKKIHRNLDAIEFSNLSKFLE